MALLSDNRVAWQYHSDDGKVYRVAAQKAMTDQGVLGGEAWAGVVGPRPNGIKMRRITVGDLTGKTRVLPVYSTGASILTAGTAVNVNFGGTTVAMTSSGEPIAEQRPRKSVTRQAA